MLCRTLIAAWLMFPLLCQGLESSYWVWHRTSPLSQEEAAGLRAQGVKTLYWHAGEIYNTGAEWNWKAPPFIQRQTVPGIAFVPVVRISPGVKDPFNEASLNALIVKLRPLAAGGELQIDFDCPDRLLGDYAKALKKIHGVIPALTITALAGWSRAAQWKELQGSVDGIFPMFYDLQPDANLASADPQPLLDAKDTGIRIAEWGACGIPWLAGLPSFARLTLFDAGGRSLGNIRAWGWDDVVFNKCLTFVKCLPSGTLLMRVEMDGVVANTPVKRGQTLAARWPSRASLADAAAAAGKAGARGVIYFGLPDGTDPGGWSLQQMGGIASQDQPRLVLREKTPGRLTLVNDSGIDLEPRFAGNGGGDRGYELELDSGAPVFREAGAGDFWKVTGHANPDTKPALVAIPLATRLTFWFSHLRAGESLDCGLIQLAPGATLKQVRYRILQQGDAWHLIE